MHELPRGVESLPVCGLQELVRARPATQKVAAVATLTSLQSAREAREAWLRAREGSWESSRGRSSTEFSHKRVWCPLDGGEVAGFDGFMRWVPQAVAGRGQAWQAMTGLGVSGRPRGSVR